MPIQMTIEEAAKYFGVSKEAIHNRIRRGTLEVVVQNGIKNVLIDPNMPKKSTTSNKNSQTTEEFNNFLKEQNRELQQKIEKLEAETRRLREEKEQMLIEERRRIEQIYKEKDEQLKNILNAISSKFLLEAKPLDEEHFEVEIEEPKRVSPISLKKFIKQANLNKKREKKILKKIKKIAKKEERFMIKDSKIYLDPSSFDYSDLL
ncbi:hypothetical protein MNB_SM-7-696 [hydrothermal vent metagenome]|uniref:Uncharacterized protein n=1 Tax=hydrothermal vent metagenome TaxID=652676 RepID=A0A1W1C2W2_9ZZZZ